MMMYSFEASPSRMITHSKRRAAAPSYRSHLFKKSNGGVDAGAEHRVG